MCICGEILQGTKVEGDGRTGKQGVTNTLERVLPCLLPK